MQLRDFRGFRFGKVHSSDLNLEVVNSSGYYEARTLPNPNDQVTDIPGADGQYYFGSVYKNREITVNVAFDSVTEEIYRKIRQLFSTDKLQDLVFDEEPYKTWKAKLKSKPDFKSICFIDKETGQRVYKGDGKLSFICYCPYAFGFDKYVIKAADYYILTPPENIIKASQENFDNVFIAEDKTKNEKILVDEKYCYNMELTDDKWKDTRFHYNVNPSNDNRDKLYQNKQSDYSPNDDIKWETGFPTIEQVERGELYYDTENGEKSLIDVRGYWDNIPKWQSTAKLLTTPTLDYEQELMFMPQYSKTNYVNMEVGFNKNRPMIGAKMLVYNPGDIPVDWELKIDENKRGFWSSRSGTKFRISRYNVQRLPIPCAVDWCGLKTYDEFNDNDAFKYGNRYFVRKTLDTSAFSARFNELDNRIDFDSKIALPMEKRSGDKKYYNEEDYLEAFNNGRLPADKGWEKTGKTNGEINSLENSNHSAWQEYQDNKCITYYEDSIDTAYVIMQGTPSEQVRTRTALNLHLSLSGSDKDRTPIPLDYLKIEYFNKNHPHHCYYVEPIPREQLGEYIRMFYKQTNQFKGDRPTNVFATANSSQWITMFPNDFEKKSEGYFFKNVNSPLLDILKMFVVVLCRYNGTVEDQVEAYIPFDAQMNEYFINLYANLDYNEGMKMAEAYENEYEMCTNDMERFELYWSTLKELLKLFTPILKTCFPEIGESAMDEKIEEFIYDYINNPNEYIRFDGKELDYKKTLFNGYVLPTWVTDDYLDIDAKDLSNTGLISEYLSALGLSEETYIGQKIQYTNANREELIAQGKMKLVNQMDEKIGVNGFLSSILDDSFYLNSEKHMLYAINKKYNLESQKDANKIVYNEAIKKGNWFKLPPGWSLIVVEPVMDHKKTWIDMRPSDWGYGGDYSGHKLEPQQLYDFIYSTTADYFFEKNPKIKIAKIISNNNSAREEDYSDVDYLNFRRWYEQQINNFKSGKSALAQKIEHVDEYGTPIGGNNDEINYFKYCYFLNLQEKSEYEFIKMIYENWNLLSPYYTWTVFKGAYYNPQSSNPEPPTETSYGVDGLPLRSINGQVDDWWWYACNYTWANEPPPFWPVADMINSMSIDFTPLYN